MLLGGYGRVNPTSAGTTWFVARRFPVVAEPTPGKKNAPISGPEVTWNAKRAVRGVLDPCW